MEQWRLAQSPPESPPSSSSSSDRRQVVAPHPEGMLCGDPNTQHLRLVFQRAVYGLTWMKLTWEILILTNSFAAS